MTEPATGPRSPRMLRRFRPQDRVPASARQRNARAGLTQAVYHTPVRRVLRKWVRVSCAGLMVGCPKRRQRTDHRHCHVVGSMRAAERFSRFLESSPRRRPIREKDAVPVAWGQVVKIENCYDAFLHDGAGQDLLASPFLAVVAQTLLGAPHRVLAMRQRLEDGRAHMTMTLPTARCRRYDSCGGAPHSMTSFTPLSARCAWTARPSVVATHVTWPDPSRPISRMQPAGCRSRRSPRYSESGTQRSAKR